MRVVTLLLSVPVSPVQALCWCAAHDGCNGTPLRGHELGQVQQLLILLARPLGLFDAGVQPLVPAVQRSTATHMLALLSQYHTQDTQYSQSWVTSLLWHGLRLSELRYQSCGMNHILSYVMHGPCRWWRKVGVIVGEARL